MCPLFEFFPSMHREAFEGCGSTVGAWDHVGVEGYGCGVHEVVRGCLGLFNLRLENFSVGTKCICAAGDFFFAFFSPFL